MYKRELVMIDKVYKLNNSSLFEIMHKPSLKSVSRIFDCRKLKIGLTLIIFSLFPLISGYVLAMLITSPPLNSPKPLGNVTAVLHANNVKDLYSWQAIIVFDANQIRVLEVMPGEFFQVEYPFLLNVTDLAEGVLLLGGTLLGNVSGKSGTGALVTVLFEYYVEEYEMPRLVFSEKGFTTCLFNSKGLIIPIVDTTTLALTIEGE